MNPQPEAWLVSLTSIALVYITVWTIFSGMRERPAPIKREESKKPVDDWSLFEIGRIYDKD